MRAGPAARVSYLGVNELDDAAWQIGHQQAVGDRDSTITLATVALGGHYARVRTEARVAGPGGSTRQIALYFAGGEQMHDFRTIQDHDAPHTTSDLLFKGAVQDSARSVYTGLIKIRPHARGTSAFQTNRNLTLSEGAWAESVPNLEIETNDVKCSHASTVGPIDPEQRFYLESRGIPTPVAERLVVLGFFDEVLDQLPVGPLAGRLRAPGVGQARPRPHARRGGVMASTTFPLDELEPGTARRVEVDGVARRRRAHRRRRVRHRRRVQPRQRVAVRGRGVVRRAGDRVPEARQHVRSRDRRAGHPAGHPARAGLRRRRWSTAR